jgi:hypothetical protein
MENKEKSMDLESSNEIIADFLDWEKRFDDYEQAFVYKVPNNFYEDTGWTEWAVDSFLFDNDWEWCLYLWDMVHRKICIPIMKDNKHLRSIRPLVQRTKKSIIWCHREDTYRNIIKLIEFYNSQFDKV